MAQDLAKNLTEWAAPVFEELELSVYDIEVTSGRIVVTVTRPGGVGLDEIARCTRRLSVILDERDPVAGHYTLEVSSPGLERRLRTVEHRRAAIGETVKCKSRDALGVVHRVDGNLSAVDDEAMTIASAQGPVRVPHAEVTSVRTVFVWPEPAGSKSSKTKSTGRPEARREPTTQSGKSNEGNVRKPTP